MKKRARHRTRHVTKREDSTQGIWIVIGALILLLALFAATAFNLSQNSLTLNEDSQINEANSIGDQALAPITLNEDMINFNINAG